LEASFGKAAKAFDAINVACSHDKLVAAMFDTKMFGIADIRWPVIAAPAVTVDAGFRATRPRVMACSVALEQLGTISVLQFGTISVLQLERSR
jgi:hypothetical protein